MGRGRAERRMARFTVRLIIKLFIIYIILAMVRSFHVPFISGAARIGEFIIGVTIEIIILLFIIFTILYIIGINSVKGMIDDIFKQKPKPYPGWNKRAQKWKKILRSQKELIKEIIDDIEEIAREAANAVQEIADELLKQNTRKRNRPPPLPTRNRDTIPTIPEKPYYSLKRTQQTTPTIPDTGFPQLLTGKFIPLEFLGEGGFSKVWKVRSHNPPGVYALKLPKLTEESAIKLFAKEAVHWDDLGKHPNIVRLYAWGLQPMPWILVEYIDGIIWNNKKVRSLRELLFLHSKKKLPQCLAFKIALDTAKALKHAHKRNIAHLDLKPSNILLSQTTSQEIIAKLTDWGMSKAAMGTSSASGATPAYLTPEHTPYSPYHRKGIGAWTDVYQLGLVLYEMLTGSNYNKLLLYEDPEEVIMKVNDPEARILLERMLEPDPDKRPSTEEIVEELDKLFRSRCGRMPGRNP